VGISSSDNSLSIGSLATILTVAGVAIYVLGLVGLAVTIRLRFAKDISTAWYAVSLLPRTIVAGQGIRIWLGWPIVLTVVMSFGILLLESFGVDEGVSVIIVIISAILIGLGFGSVFFWRAWKASPLTGLPPVAGLIGVIVAMGGSGPVVAPIVITLFSSLVWGVFAALSSMLGSAVMLIAGLLIMRGLGSGYAEDYLFGIVDAVPPDKSALVGAIILFVGGFIIGKSKAPTGGCASIGRAPSDARRVGDQHFVRCLHPIFCSLLSICCSLRA
jgi:hypothetical protein